MGDIGRIRSREKTQRNNRRTSRLFTCGTHATTSWVSWTRPPDAGRSWLTRAFEDSDVSMSSPPEELPERVERAEVGLGFLKRILAGWDTISTDEAGAMRRLRSAAARGHTTVAARAPEQDRAREGGHHALAWRARHLVLPVVDDRGDVNSVMRPSLAHRSAVRCLGARLNPASHLQSQEVA